MFKLKDFEEASELNKERNKLLWGYDAVANEDGPMVTICVTTTKTSFNGDGFFPFKIDLDMVKDLIDRRIDAIEDRLKELEVDIDADS